MYSVIKSDLVIDKIDNFIKSYLNGFLNLFYDSGIENLGLIEKNYENISIELKSKILFSLEEYLSRNIIGKSIGEKGELSFVISVGNFKLFVDFTENIKEKIRFIENIEFYKK